MTGGSLFSGAELMGLGNGVDVRVAWALGTIIRQWMAEEEV